MKNKDIYVTINDKEIKVIEGIKYENDELCVITNQKLYNLKQEEMNVEELIKVYKEKTELANVISNTFTVIIIDKIQKKLVCIQDVNGDTIPVYYYNNTEIIFTNKLLNIILNYSKEFEMNEKAIPYFVKKGFIPNKETLVKDIYKIIPGYNFEMNLLNRKIKFIKKKIKYPKINYTTDLYIEEFGKIININSKDKKIFTTLSNGYDSNFIYSFLDKNKPIEAFSIGGVTGRDETIQVRENIKAYNNTNLNIAYVSEETLNNYLDLVYNLEGAVYERGIFLQYELANKIKSKNEENTILFAGEGADQIFSAQYHNKIFYFWKMLKYIIKKILKRDFGDDLRNIFIKGGILDRTNPYNFLDYVITKKNGILMNNIGVNYIYPYLSKNIINFGYLNRYKNIKGKKSHKEACNKKIDSNILKNITKVGGSTEAIALFENCSYMNEIEEVVKNSKFNILRIKEDLSSDSYREYLLKVLYLEIFEYLFIKNASKINEYKEMKLSEFLKQ